VVGASVRGASDAVRLVSEAAPFSPALRLLSAASGARSSAVSESVGVSGECSCGDTSGALSGT